MSHAERAFDLVLFDLDGTLIDSAAQLALAVNLTLTDLGLAQADEAVIRTWVGNGADKLIQRALAYREADPELFTKARPIFFQHYNACLLQGLAMYDGVAQSLRRLQTLGYKQAIVTNKPRLRGTDPRCSWHQRFLRALARWQLRAGQEAEPGAAAARLPGVGGEPGSYPDGGRFRK